MTNKTVMVPVELLEAAIEYMEYTHNGDPYEEDARAMGEMGLDDIKHKYGVDHFKTILKAAPKVEGEPVGYLDLSRRTKITDNPYFTVGPVTNHPGWFPVYAAPQQAKAELNFDIDTFALNLMQEIWSIGNMYKPDEQRKEMIQVAITNAIEGLIQPPEKPE